MSSEKDAFHALELLSHAFPSEAWSLQPNEFYSPTAARNGSYSARLKQGKAAHPPELEAESSKSDRQRLTPNQAKEALRDAHQQGMGATELRLLLGRLAEASSMHPLELDKLSEAARLEVEQEAMQEREAQRLLQEIDRQEIAAGITLPLLLPPPLADALATVTKHLPYDDRVVVVAFLALLGGLTKLGTIVNGCPASGFTVPTNLFVAMVGDTGKKKSPLARAVVLDPVKPLRLELNQQNDRARKAWEEQCRGLKRDERPPEPIAAHIYANDYTGEALAALLQELEARGLALLLHRDELAGLFGSLNAYRQGADEQQLLELFDGDGFTSLRVKAGARHYGRAHVSIYGTIQPQILARLVSGDDSNGKWARFLFCPLPPITRPLPELVGLEEEQALDAAANTLQRIARAVYTLSPAEYRLAPDALAWFVRFEHEQQQQGQTAELGPQRALHGKAAGKVLRVAGLLHIAARACADPELALAHTITLPTLQNAILLVQTLDQWAAGFHAEATAADAGGIDNLTRRIHNLSAQHARRWVGWREVSRSLSGQRRRKVDRAVFMSAVCRLAADNVGEKRPGSRGGVQYRAIRDPI